MSRYEHEVGTANPAAMLAMSVLLSHGYSPESVADTFGVSTEFVEQLRTFQEGMAARLATDSWFLPNTH